MITKVKTKIGKILEKFLSQSKNIQNLDRKYGIEHEEDVVKVFCAKNNYTYTHSSDYEDKVQKFDYKIYDHKKNHISNLSIKCSRTYENVSYQKRDMISDNASTHILFENCLMDQYIIETKHLHNLIKKDKNNKNKSLNDLFEKYSGIEIIEYHSFYVIPEDSLKKFPDVKLKKI